MLLKVSDLVVNYGHVQAVQGVSLEVNDGEIVAVIGANGAGKTTTLKAVMGLVPITKGAVSYKGSSLVGKKAHGVVRLGLSMVPEGRQLFADQSVHDNLLLGAYSIVGNKKQKMAQLMEREYERFPILRQRRDQQAGTLSGGEQQMLAIARGLMADPQMLLMDEPSMGLAPLLVQEIMRAIQALNKAGLTILLVEQMASIALSICHRAYVMAQGEVKISGTGRELLSHPEVVKSYLGGSAA